MVRVFIVEDQLVAREGIRLLLANETKVEVIGETENGTQLLAQLPATAADVVLLSWNSFTSDSLQVARQVQQRHPAVRVLVLSALQEEEAVYQMLDCGVAGYALKKSTFEEIIYGIHRVAAGYFFLCSDLGFHFLSKLRQSSRVQDQEVAGVLSQREEEVLQLIAVGLTTSQIADKLFVSIRTIESHRQNMISKLQVKNTASLIRYALKTGLIS